MPGPIERVRFWRNCERVLYTFPQVVQEGLLWTFEELAEDPSVFPADPERWIETTELHGAGGARRVAARRYARDPGFRGIYFYEGDRVSFLRFRDRESEPYRDLGKLLRAYLAERKG